MIAASEACLITAHPRNRFRPVCKPHSTFASLRTSFLSPEILSNVVYRREAHPLLNDWLGGLLGLFFAIDELNADDDLGDEFKALESTPMLLGFQGELKDHRQGRDP
jgi:hypothetical protein